MWTETLWEPINDHPGDQRYDHIPGSSGRSHWGEVGPEHNGRWSWTIISVDDGANQEEFSGTVATEADAKAFVEAWRPEKEETGA